MQKKGIACAVLAAAFYALNAPFSKLLLGSVSPAMMAALLYLGAGFGMAVLQLAGKRRTPALQQHRFTRKELPYVIGMVVLDIAAPIALMVGITQTAAANVALLNNFEIVATSLIALLVFHERISAKLWGGIVLVTLASILLSVPDAADLSFSWGSVYVLIACICWGMENNCTRMLSGGNPVQIVVVKGIGSGAGSLLVALLAREAVPGIGAVALALLLGFVAYGLSIVFYIYAQRWLGAAKTSAYYAIAPFIGAGLSLLIFREAPSGMFLAALAVMIGGTYLVTVADAG